MASTPQILAIALTFLCDHFINNYKDKKWLSNVILLSLLGISIIFVCLLDEKLERQEVELTGRLQEQNKTKKEIDVIEVNIIGKILIKHSLFLFLKFIFSNLLYLIIIYYK